MHDTTRIMIHHSYGTQHFPDTIFCISFFRPKITILNFFLENNLLSLLLPTKQLCPNSLTIMNYLFPTFSAKNIEKKNPPQFCE